MTALRAAVLNQEHHRAHMVAALQALALEAAHQADRVRLGIEYDDHRMTQRRAAVTEARETLDAVSSTVYRMMHPTGHPAAGGTDPGHRPRGTNPTRTH